MLRENVKEVARLHTELEDKKHALTAAEGIPADGRRLMFPSYKLGLEFKQVDDRAMFEIKQVLINHYKYQVEQLERKIDELL